MTIDDIAYDIFIEEFNTLKLYEYLTPPSKSEFIDGKNHETSFYKTAKNILRKQKLEKLNIL